MENGVSFYRIFSSSSLEKIGNLNLFKCTNIIDIIESLAELLLTDLGEIYAPNDSTYFWVPMYYLVNFGGFKDRKYSFGLIAPNLSHESLMNIINKLAVVTTNETCELGVENLAKLTEEEKQIAINKGWILA